MNNELYFNYKKSLKQKYNAICFDIDGTLTKKNSKKIDERAVSMIVELLKKKIPVVFITGRGETGLNDLKNDIYNSIVNSDNITENDMMELGCFLVMMFLLKNFCHKIFIYLQIVN